tara:strand:+ start:6952 stop:7977 length:1026 start_codon:yes stop_codon:yes gene_type:complete
MNKTPSIEPVIWALIDERPGTGNQTRAVAKSLGLPFEEKKLNWIRFAELPNLLIGASLRGLSESSKSEIKSPWPDLVIAAGRRSGSVARYIKKQSLDDCCLVHIMNPGDSAIRDFDLIAVPNHDGAVQDNPNIMRTIGAPHGIGNSSLSEARVRWHAEFSEFEKPLIGLVLGGATKRRPFTAEMARELGRQSGDLVKQLGGSFIVTSSPRTGSALDAVLSGLTNTEIEPAFVYRWSLEDSAIENPYLGIIAMADQLIVTGDSTSMCSEVCASGKPVHIFAPEGFLGDKHRRLVAELCENNYAQLLAPGVEISATPPPGKLDAAGQIAEEIRIRLLPELDGT